MAPSWLAILATAGLGFTAIYFLYYLKKYFGGGVCISKERLDGKTVLITGCNVGIGRETVLDMCRRGARVAMLCRSLEKAKEAAKYVRQQVERAEIVLYRCDLSSMKSVRECALEINATEKSIDILINNAGVMMCPFTITEDGFEMQMGTNHFGHFLLTNLLLDKIRKSSPSRIINLSSDAHEWVSFNLDVNYKNRSYTKKDSYGQSKLANILFTRELAKRLEGTGVTTYAVHPGLVYTELSRHFGIFKFVWWIPARFFAKNPTEGTQTSIQCAVAKELAQETGKYYADCKEKEPRSQAKDDVVARKLWDLSVKAVKLDE